MILNHKEAIDYICDWIKDYAKSHNKENLIVGLSGGVNSALVALLCQRSGINTNCYIIDCDSNDQAIILAQKFAGDFDLNKSVINAYNLMMEIDGNPQYLRFAILNSKANNCNGLNVGTIDRSEYRLTRDFVKHGDGAVDIAPLADLYKSEIYELFEYLVCNGRKFNEIVSAEESFSEIKESAEDIYLAKPNKDLDGKYEESPTEQELGFTYDELEWAAREDSNNFIISNDPSPTSNYNWIRYTGRHKQIIAQLHQIEKQTRDKINPNLPFPSLRKERFIR